MNRVQNLYDMSTQSSQWKAESGNCRYHWIKWETKEGTGTQQALIPRSNPNELIESSFMAEQMEGTADCRKASREMDYEQANYSEPSC